MPAFEQSADPYGDPYAQALQARIEQLGAEVEQADAELAHLQARRGRLMLRRQQLQAELEDMLSEASLVGSTERAHRSVEPGAVVGTADRGGSHDRAPGGAGVIPAGELRGRLLGLLHSDENKSWRPAHVNAALGTSYNLETIRALLNKFTAAGIVDRLPDKSYRLRKGAASR